MKKKEEKESLVYSMCAYSYTWGYNKVVAQEENYFKIICSQCLRISIVCQKTGGKFLNKEVRNDFSGPKPDRSFGTAAQLFHVN